MRIDFVIPVYNERDTLEPLATGILSQCAGRDCRILFVDDGSTDGSYEAMRALQQRHPEVDILRLRGNFGKSLALAAGFARADADLVFTMDSDLQDDPKEIPRFLDKIGEGYDVVCGWKKTRHDPWHKTIPSRWYNRFVSWLFDLPIHDVNCGYKLYRGDVVKHIGVYGEMHRLIPVMAHNLNYRVTEIPVEHHRRRYGRSKFGFARFSRGALDVLTMWFLTRYRHQPGHFFGKLGGVQILAGVFALLVAVLAVLAKHAAVVPAVALLFAIVLVLAGGFTICLGLLAELMLHHFIRINPTVYEAENDGR